MKSTIKLFTLALVALFAVSCNNNDEYDMLNSLWRNVTQNEARIDDLEKWCSQANTNITSLQTIVNVIESNDMVTSVTPIMEGGVEVGYTITFADHDPITIYHGSDGQNGQDGTDGQDGVTPQLKIEADYWWISYDNGNTWTQLGKAKGDKGDTGATGAAGADGQDGDSMFQSVTQDAVNVYFTLADGTVITIAKGDNTNYLYTITYMPNGGEGEMKVDTVRYGRSYTIKSCTFSYPEYGFVEWNTSADGRSVTYFPAESIVVIKNIILYAQWSDCVENGYVWIDLGLSVKWATCNVGATTPIGYGKYYAWGETAPKSSYSSSNYNYSGGGFSDAARVNWGGAWRMPTDAEWTELLKNCTWTWTDDYNGTGVAGRIVKSKTNGNHIFLPAAGYRSDDDLYYAGFNGDYWSSSRGTGSPDYAWSVDFRSGDVSRRFNYRYYGRSVRPVLE